MPAPQRPDETRVAVATGKHRWLALGAIALAVSLVIMDATIANVALPVVIEDIHLTATQAQWMNAIYALVFAGLILTSGRLGDLYGRRRLLLIGLVLFGVASLFAGSADSGAVLVAARFVQGLGAAAIFPSTLSTINAMFTRRDRSIAFAVYGAMIGGMAALGPLVGGWLATDFTWRWAFWLNLPFVVIAAVGTLLLVPETRDVLARRGLDLLGVLLASVGMASIVFGLIESSTYGWVRQESGALSPVIVTLVAGLLLIGVFVLVEQRRARAGRVVLVDLGLFRLPTLRYGAIAALVVALGEFGLLFTLPLLLQGAMGYDALGTGWLMVALAAGTFVISGMTPRLTERFGQRAVVRAGLLLEAVAVGGLALVLPADGWVIAGLLFVYGTGVGLATAQLTSVMLSQVPVAQSGEASGLQSTVRQLGSALGVALLGGLLIGNLGTGLAGSLSDTSMPVAQQQQVVRVVKQSAGAAIPALEHQPGGAAAVPLARDAMISAAKETTGLASGVLALGLIATLALPSGRREDAVGEPETVTADRHG
ncbi:MAG: MFS transporter [Intrasporangium sp.]|uniref:MFS transporter n=1 Tax=Intrasporangium sp. TaxID=1925024 RepID=UPI00264714B0|nr:MFS transporter [Intrasporangium sp.]MDN5798146.1 MFS transporter [Intrasporangium sp.]